MSRFKRSKIPEPLRVGDRLLDRYCIVERITSGGHSVVYRGEDERLHRPVCIKVFHRVRSGDGPYRTAYEHFVQEAFALSGLTHPNTLRIYDFGHLDGDDDNPGPPFQVSEFMTHGTLWSQVKVNGPMSFEEAITIVTALGEALAEAHHASLIHRDIKPHNILFTAAGSRLVVKLADFGIAKALPTEGAQLRHRADDTSVVVGRPFLMYSPWWAAPEQLSGMSVGRPADIFALALSVIYMLTGKVVFRENDAVKAYQQRKDSARYVGDACEGSAMPPDVVSYLREACDFAPENRPDDAERFARVIADALREQMRASTNPSPPQLSDLTTAASRAWSPEADNPAIAATPDDLSSAQREQSPMLAASTASSVGSSPQLAMPSSEGFTGAQSSPGHPYPGPSYPAHHTSTHAGSAEAALHHARPRLQSLPGAAGAALPGQPVATPPRRLRVSDHPQMVADRQVLFVPAAGGDAQVACLGGQTRLRVAFVPGAGGFCVHVRGLSCFVARDHGRPSSGVVFEHDGLCHLVTPGRHVLGTALVALGKFAAGHRVFTLGEQSVAINLDDCPQIAAIDFGAGSECVFVYRPGPALTPPPPRRARAR